LLDYNLTDAIERFEEGDYEMAFISGYKVICEVTVVDPKEYVSDQRKGGLSFSDIRTILVHSRSHRKYLQISPEEIKTTRRKLPQYCVELLHRCFTFMNRVVYGEKLRR
jgi:hypothetical protein